MNYLKENHILLQKMLREFTKKEIEPQAGRFDREREFPKEIIKKLGGMGILGITIPEEREGAGLDTLSYVVAIEGISQGCASSGLLVAITNSLVASALVLSNNEGKKKEYLSPLIAGEIFASAVEMEGSTILAELQENEYLLNGKAVFLIGGSVGKIFVVSANSTSGQEPICFLIEGEIPGFDHGQKIETIGMKAADIREITMNNCRIPKENVLIEKERLTRVFCLYQLGIGAIALGISQACLEQSIKYAKERHQFGQPIGRFEMVQEMLTDMATRTEASRGLLYQSALKMNEDRLFPQEVAMAKLHTTQAAVANSKTAVQIHGGYGYTKDYPVERYFRDAKMTEILGGSSEKLKVAIAESLLET
ncbi:MAG: acyl-CoA dehydrogenase family protein [Candidatus Edwardsbacteria bacterium]